MFVIGLRTTISGSMMNLNTINCKLGVDFLF
jgi:hypothetical protein